MSGQAKLTFRGLSPASPAATRAARGASKKAHTKCELVLRRALWAAGLRYRVSPAGLPGRPDIVFTRQQLAIFCDGDFWHGRNLDVRLAKLARGHNAPYWVEKIRANVARDTASAARLHDMGWRVIRFWESDILANPLIAASVVVGLIRHE